MITNRKLIGASLVGALVFITGFVQSSSAQEKPPLYMFVAEMETFVEKALDLKEKAADLSDDEIKARLNEMTVVAARASKVYFAQIETSVKPELDEYLGERINENPEIRHFYVLLGNQFLSVAREVINQRAGEEKKFRMYSTVGGSLLGLAAGGAVLYFAKGVAKNALTAGLLVVGLGVAGGVGGYVAGPAVAKFALPADPSIKNADDFLKRYPAGEDFVSDLEDSSPDLSMRLAQIDEALALAR
jgi:hypothetical protein